MDINYIFMVTFYVYLITLAKALTIGSEFNFYLWIRYGKKYMSWYFNRPNFKP
jgi:hypothetical protein